MVEGSKRYNHPFSYIFIYVCVCLFFDSQSIDLILDKISPVSKKAKNIHKSSLGNFLASKPGRTKASVYVIKINELKDRIDDFLIRQL